MVIYLLWPPTPLLSSIFEVANQLFFLGVDADNRVFGANESRFNPADIAKLLIALWMLCARH